MLTCNTFVLNVASSSKMDAGDTSRRRAMRTKDSADGLAPSLE